MTTSAVKHQRSIFRGLGKAGILLGFFVAMPIWFGVNLARHDVVNLSGPTMGTSYSIRLLQTFGEPKLGTIQKDVNDLLKNINQQMSTYLPDSELSRFNAAPAEEWFAVSKETAFVVQQALHIHELTSGTSDVTVGPLVRLWDFGPGRHAIGTSLDSPEDDLIAQAKARTGGDKLEVRLAPPALRKLVEGLEVDLSSIAKGYAVDAVAELLIDRGYENFMVEIGGEVRARGARPDGKPWRIGIERPDLRQRSIHQVVELNDRALATSGDYRNFRRFDGQQVSHVIDPRSGHPLPYRGWSVTLLTPTCLEADALATALLVMGEQAGYDWCVEQQLAALFLIRVGDQIVEKATPQFLELETSVVQTQQKE